MKRNTVVTQKGWAALGRNPNQAGIPVIGSIAAGVPIFAVENHDHYIEDLRPAPGRFALRVRGDSMINAGINDGDYAIINGSHQVNQKEIAAVILGEEATLKRVHFHQDGGVDLIPENDAYSITHVDPERANNELRIIGPLHSIYRNSF